MKKGVKVVLIVLLIAILLIAGLHITLSFFNGKGLFSFLPLNSGSILNFFRISPISYIILAAEWVLIFILVIYMFRGRKKEKSEEQDVEKPVIVRNKMEKITDLDVFYKLVKERKHVRLSTVMRVFEINRKIALDWAKILESANLVKIDYPRIGEPEILMIS